ncbi:MAG TPA: hypothetical protein PKA10_11140 [Selenomonadales bacterium]|nr:hypothetical protein [Selenomonadales bacterium]
MNIVITERGLYFSGKIKDFRNLLARFAGQPITFSLFLRHNRP